MCFLIQSVSRSVHFGPPEGPGPRKGVFGGSETGRPEGRPERPPRRSTTRSKSTRSSRLCSVSLSSVLFRSVLLRDVVVGKIFFLRPKVGLDFLFCVHRSDQKLLIRPLDVLDGPGHVVGRRRRRAQEFEPARTGRDNSQASPLGWTREVGQ